ncbi:MAG: VOC family protein [Actinomycetes bacterium]
MALSVQVTFDAADPEGLADFWCAVLGYRKDWTWDEPTTQWMLDGGLPKELVGARAAASDPDGVGPRLFFQRVSEPKTAKNRVHLDVRASEDKDAAVARITALGATVLRDFTEQLGPLPEERTIVMADPEGNEFCL